MEKARCFTDVPLPGHAHQTDLGPDAVEGGIDSDADANFYVAVHNYFSNVGQVIRPTDTGRFNPLVPVFLSWCRQFIPASVITTKTATVVRASVRHTEAQCVR